MELTEIFLVLDTPASIAGVAYHLTSQLFITATVYGPFPELAIYQFYQVDW